MAFSLNKIMLIGNLGQDAETRFTTSNKSVTNFSLATTESRKDDNGNWVNDTTWHDIGAWELPDFIKDALKKGKKIFVQGRLSKRNYTDKEGIKRHVTEVIAERYNGIIILERTESSSNYSVDNPEAPSNENDLDL